MTESQRETWETLRIRDKSCEAKRSTFPEYVNGSTDEVKHTDFENDVRLVPIEDYERMQKELQRLYEKIEKVKNDTPEDFREKNEALGRENATLEAQLESANVLFEANLEKVDDLNEKYSDLEEALADKVNAFFDDTDPRDAERQLALMEQEFEGFQSSMRHQSGILFHNLYFTLSY